MSERIINFKAAFDKRDIDPKKNYGIHGVDLYMILKGKKGAVSFTLFTGWYLPHIDLKSEPLPADLSYHSYMPMFEDHEPHGECMWLDNHICYCDGSTLNAEGIWQALLHKGSEGVWQELENYYESVFKEKP